MTENQENIPTEPGPDAEGPVSDGPEWDDQSVAAGAEAAKGEDDSASFSRCASCRHASEADRAAGTLLCAKHNMRINADADEIPDDCPEYEPAEPA